jgi:putative hemolysin
MRLVLYLILLLVLVNAIVLDKALNLLTFKELKRRARGGHDKKAAAIYKMAAYGRSLNLLLWIAGSLSAALLFVSAVSSSWLLAIIYVAALAWAVRAWRPNDVHDWVWSWAAAVAPVMAWKMVYLQPILRRLSGPKRRSAKSSRAGIYEVEDLLELLKEQSSQPGNRISEPELKMAFHALTFGDKKVGDVMTPLRKVRLVAEDEEIGPLLMDELHQTGFSRFPVAKINTAKNANPEIAGTLFMKDLIGYEGSGRVRELMHKKAYYINETQSLRDGLAAFLKMHHHLFIVVNNFEEIVGVLSIEDVIEQILGAHIVDEFDRYDDLRAVAGLEASDEHAAHEHVKTSEQTSQTVVE